MLYLLAMAHETVFGQDVSLAIKQLESVLKENYLNAERLMSLRHPNVSTLNAILAKINEQYTELMGAMASANLESDAIVAVTHNHDEFFNRKHEWLSKSGHSPSDIATVPTVKATTSRQSSSQTTSSSYSRHSSKSSEFSKSTSQATSRSRHSSRISKSSSSL